MNNHDALKEDFKGYLNYISKPFKFLEVPLICLISPIFLIIMLPFILFLLSPSFTKAMWDCNHMEENTEQ